MEIIPRSPEGILDMRGPSTLEGGYSPSQVISSDAILRDVKDAEDGMMVVVVAIAARGMGAKAADRAMIADRMKKVSFAILFF
jgi:hypothetical protein